MSTWKAHIPGHIFFLMVSELEGDAYIHVAFFIAILLICLLRIFQFLTFSSRMPVRRVQDRYPHLDSINYRLTFQQISCDVFGFAIFTYPLAFSILMLSYERGIGYLILWFVATWQTDNGALFFGSAFGKHLFSQAISPKKTWEGVSGGIFLSVVSGLAMSFYRKYYQLDYFPDFATKHYLIICLLVALISIFGDLVESFIKRAAEVKDSGALFPGHGGVLDRLDSLAFSAPIVYFYIKFVIGFD
eukprot:TRINITY_DN3432_c0_g1_i6.p2 TRINITY_DN3432_c0_g1~~TRINITY_DN3432_c0_g1_i6.p2  ORF type:complete len:245 (-),score=38.50 TRINITY_DN3432_c0_g1_i6:121-855(-)